MHRARCLLAVTALLSCASIAAAQARQLPVTYRGATLAQWLDPAYVPVTHEPAKLFADKAAREHALAAFGVLGEPKRFLLDALASEGDELRTMKFLLPVVQDLPDAQDYVDALRQRWLRRPWDSAVLEALLRAAPETWPGVAAEVHRRVQADVRIDHPLLAAIPADCALDEDWHRLLAAVLDTTPSRDTRVLPTRPTILTRCRKWQQALAAGGYPNSMDLDALRLDPTWFGPEVDAIVQRLHEALGTNARPRVWDCGDSYFPRPQAFVLGGAGAAAIPAITALLTSKEASHRTAGRIALGALARGDAQHLPLVLDELRATGNGGRGSDELTEIGEMCCIAGAPLVPLLVAELPSCSPAVADLVLTSLLMLHGQLPRGVDPVPTAASPLDPRLQRTLLASRFDAKLRWVDNRTLAVRLAAMCERGRPIADDELPAFEHEAMSATMLTTSLYLDACRCIEHRGDWLQYLSTRCKGEVKDILLAIAVRTPSWDPWDPVRGIALPSWHSRVLALDRGLREEKLSRDRAESIANHDNDLFVRAFARKALDG